MPMDIKPSDKAMKEAVEFLSMRIEAEQTFSIELVALLKKYAKELVEVGYRYKIQPKDFQFSANKDFNEEVNALIAKLRNEIFMLLDYCVMIGSEYENEMNELLGILGTLGNGKQSVYQQIATYTNRFKFEIEAFIGAGLIAGVSQSVVLSHYVTNMKSPWTDKLITDAFKEKGVKAERLKNKGVSYGVGRSNVAVNLLNRIGVGSIAISWWEFESGKFKDNGAIGYMQYRGSTYPCELCDSEARFHPITDLDIGYPHAHCRCYRVPIYNSDINMI